MVTHFVTIFRRSSTLQFPPSGGRETGKCAWAFMFWEEISSKDWSLLSGRKLHVLHKDNDNDNYDYPNGWL